MELLTDKLVKAVVAALQELEALLGSQQLDVEFAINEADELFIFQVGPIANYTARSTNFAFDVPLQKMYKKVEKLMRPHPFCQGEAAYFSNMLDWNVAKVFGARPKKLAVTLCMELLTDHVWAQRRGDYGYQRLSSQPLMISLCGVPYIDVRASFNSFVPASLADKLAEKLVNFYLKKFKDAPIYHDKMEYDIVYSCSYFGLPEQLSELSSEGFSAEEVKEVEAALLALTKEILGPES
jgi:hypothetical protein